MTRIRLLSAFQVLTLPEGAANVDHARARAVVREVLGLEDLPATNPAPRESLEDYLLHWLGLELA